MFRNRVLNFKCSTEFSAIYKRNLLAMVSRLACSSLTEHIGFRGTCDDLLNVPRMFGLWCAIFLGEAQTIIAARPCQKDSRSENVSYIRNSKSTAATLKGGAT